MLQHEGDLSRDLERRADRAECGEMVFCEGGGVAEEDCKVEDRWLLDDTVSHDCLGQHLSHELCFWFQYYGGGIV